MFCGGWNGFLQLCSDFVGWCSSVDAEVIVGIV